MVDSVKGISELSAAFKMLSADMQKKTGAKMVASAASVIRKAAKENAKSQGLNKTGAYIRNIAIKREKNAGQGVIQYNVGVRHGRALGNGKKVVKYLAVNKFGRIVTKRENDPFYWRFLEFGTKNIKPYRSITRAYENKKYEALDSMQKPLNDAIEKAGK